MRCLSCNYELKNLTEHRCPECGRAFDPADPATFRSPGEWQSQSKLWQAALWSFTILLLVMFAIQTIGFIYAVIFSKTR